MLTFKQYLDEVARSPERAEKLVDNLDKRRIRHNHMAGGPLLLKKADHGGKRNAAWNSAVWKRASSINMNKFKENPNPKYSGTPEIKHVPIDKIRDIQGAVGAKGVKKEIQVQSGNRELGHTNSSKHPKLMYHRKTDTYLPVDGNHRISAARALGASHVEAEVHTI
jgi:hypothetical protein